MDHKWQYLVIGKSFIPEGHIKDYKCKGKKKESNHKAWFGKKGNYFSFVCFESNMADICYDTWFKFVLIPNSYILIAECLETCRIQ